MDYEPKQEWFDALEEKIRDYRTAKAVGRYGESDTLRGELIDSGVIDLDTHPKWHPVFESVESRSARI